MFRELIIAFASSLLAGCLAGAPTVPADGGSDSADDVEAVETERWHVLFDNAGRNVLSGFPVLVRIPSGRAEGGFRFVDAGGDELPYEVDSTTGSEVLVWVRVPEIAGNSTDDLIVFETVAGQPSATEVWEDYHAVYHFAGASGDAVDSTGSFPGRATMDPVRTEGLIGGAFDPRSGGYFDVGMADAFKPMSGETLTVAVWIRSEGGGGFPVWHEGACVGWSIGADSDSTDARLGTGTDCTSFEYWDATSDRTVLDGEWHHLAMMIDRRSTPGSLRLLIDGESMADTSIEDDRPVNLGNFLIGRIWDFSDVFDGFVDEVQVSSRPLSIQWWSAHVANVRGDFTRWEEK